MESHIGARRCFFCSKSVVQGPRRHGPKRIRSYLLTEDYVRERPTVVDYARHLFDEDRQRQLTQGNRICYACLCRAKRLPAVLNRIQKRIDAELAIQESAIDEEFIPSSAEQSLGSCSPDPLASDNPSVQSSPVSRASINFQDDIGNPDEKLLEDLPLGERALTPSRKRRRILPAAPFVKIENGAGPSTSRQNTPPSPILEFDAEPSSPPTPRQIQNNSPSPKTFEGTPRSLKRRLQLSEKEISEHFHYGSESESEEEKDEEGHPEPFAGVRRQLAAWMETPQDDEEQEHQPELLEAEGAISYDFKWRAFPNPPVDPVLRREAFSSIGCGPTTPMVDPYRIFISIWDRQFMEQIALETNRYAEQVAADKFSTMTLSPNSRINDWQVTNADELYVYFAILIAMGVVNLSSVEEYWCTNADIFITPGFRVYMTLRRFQILSTCLHFANNEGLLLENLSASEAKLFKIEPVITMLNEKFSAMYVLNQSVTLDQSLLLYKGRLNITHLIPNQIAEVGIKTYDVCESQTGYLWRFKVHAHRQAAVVDPADPMTAIIPRLVLGLIQGLEHKGHTLWMDNFYNSPALARKLKSLGFDCVGTLRTNRLLVPYQLAALTKNQMRVNEIVGYTSGDVDVMVWRDHNRVAMISTYHGNTVSRAPNDTLKPTLICDYNICMGGLDKKDQLLAMYPMERKRNRVWYKKVFRHYLNVSVLNSYIIHKASVGKGEKPLTHRQFRKDLVQSLLANHAKVSEVSVPPMKRPAAVFVVADHYPAELPFHPGADNPGRCHRQRKQCKVCRKRVHTCCAGCNKAVCLIECFRKLHQDK